MSRRPFVAFLLLLASSLACGGGPPVDVRAAMADCQGARLTTTLELPTLAGPRTEPTLAVGVELSGEGVVVDGLPVSDLAMLAEQLTDKAATARDLAKLGGDLAFRGELLVMAPTDHAASEVVDVVVLAHASGFPNLRIVGLSDQPADLPDFVDPAYGAELSERLSTADPEQNQATLADEIQVLLRRCDGAQSGLAAIAVASPEMRCDLLIATLEQSLPMCPWVDTKKVVTAFQLVHRPPARPLTVVPLALDPEGQAFAVVEGESWGALAHRVHSSGLSRGWLATP